MLTIRVTKHGVNYPKQSDSRIKRATWPYNNNVFAAYELLEFQYKDLIEIYDIGEQVDLETFLHENLQVSDFARHMQESIDRAFPNDTKGAPDLQEFILEVK